MSRERVYATSQESQEDMLARCPFHVCINCNLQSILGLREELCLVLEPMLEVCSALRVQPAESIDDGGSNEVVPRRHAEIAVEEKEDDEDHGHEEVGCLEKFVVTVSKGQRLLEKKIKSYKG